MVQCSREVAGYGQTLTRQGDHGCRRRVTPHVRKRIVLEILVVHTFYDQLADEYVPFVAWCEVTYLELIELQWLIRVS